jgi:Ser-tRNA(Ala) deacylase AlaX
MPDNTDLLYLRDRSTEGSAVISGISQMEDGRSDLFLDGTLFYPQGGGQPYDQGKIATSTGELEVEETRFMEGVVHHIGTVQGELKTGSEAKLSVDGDRRQLNNRLHTAGHLVDIAMHKMGLKFDPGKGYHFPDSPYVEYLAMIEPEDRERVKEELSAIANELISEALPLTNRLADRDELADICLFVPDYIPEDKPSRVVFIGDYPGCPCGGTHVADLSEIGSMEIHKIKSKSGNVRLSYRLV